MAGSVLEGRLNRYARREREQKEARTERGRKEARRSYAEATRSYQKRAEAPRDGSAGQACRARVCAPDEMAHALRMRSGSALRHAPLGFWKAYLQR